MTSAALDQLRAALLSLPDSGVGGFEGLAAGLLSAATGTSFRLAATGSQFGQDGANDAAVAISFEAKLYRSKLTKSTLLNKAAEIVAKTSPPDLWILAATEPATTQIVEALRGVFALSETDMLLLDWPPNDPLPPLALLAAMAPATVVDFFAPHAARDAAVNGLDAALAVLAAHPDFAARADTLRTALADPDLGGARALAANRSLLRAAFSDRQAALVRFDQPLAPAADHALETIDRAGRAAVDALFTEPPGMELAVLTGDQGSGKSWSVAQAWLATAAPPFTLVLSATEAAAAAGQARNPQELIAEALIAQSGQIVTDRRRLRWERRFARWAAAPAAAPRFILVIDGLNESARTDWAPWLSRLVAFAARIGGRVIATSRGRYFRRVDAALSVPARIIEIGHLTDAELDAALARHDVSPSDIAARVRPSLLNPRILGIALDLLDREQIRSADELSIERLLFEHLRANQTDRIAGETPGRFIRLLADHARTTRERIAAEVDEDRFVFDSQDHASAPIYNIPADLLPVVEERFFDDVEDDPTLYRLSDDGLIYGLGIATLRELQAAARAGRSVRERLADLIEPIAALDRAAEVLFAACLVASVDAAIDDAILAALIERYMLLQNIDDDNYPAFCGIVRNRPAAALDALFVIDTGTRGARHKDWLVGALRGARSAAEARVILVARADRWLRLYTLDPAMTAFPEQDAVARERKLVEAREKIERYVAGLTAHERELVERMIREDGVDTTELCEDLFALLAGLPIAPLAEALVCWSMGRALNSSYRTKWRDYEFLVQYNRADWPETRTALLEDAACLARPDASRPARWAYVAILRATGDEEDSKAAEALASTLVDPSYRMGGWRRIESYCAVDPCDPTSTRPDNIDATAARYAELDPTQIATSRSRTEADMLMRDALTGLARFEPDAAIAVHRALAADLPNRTSATTIYSANWLDTAAVLLEPGAVEALFARTADLSFPEIDAGPDGSKDWAASQSLLEAVLPHLDGDAQLAALRSLPPHGPPLIELDLVFRAASPAAMEGALDHAIQSGEEHRLLLILAFANRSGSSLSDTALARIRALVEHPESAVRALAMQISADYPDRAQLTRFCASGWDAQALDERERHFERWYGSSMIIAAASAGILMPAEALARITPERYSDAAEALGSAETGLAIGNLLAAAFARVLSAELPFTPPQVSQVHPAGGAALFSLEDEEPELTLEQFFDRLSENDDAFQARYEQGWQRFRDFQDALTRDGALLILRDLGPPALAAVAEQDPDSLRAIANEILKLGQARTGRAGNLGARIARAIAGVDAELAVRLFRHVDGARSYVRVTHGRGKISLAGWECWHAAPSESLSSYLSERLEVAENDHALANEVLAAQFGGQKAFVEDFAVAAIASGHPVRTARALMLLGYLDQSPVAEEALARFPDGVGLIGRAAKSARGAYQRNQWSRHWFAQAAAAEDVVTFWQASILLAKIADGRWELWASEHSSGPLIDVFGWSLTKPIDRRIADWENKRKKKLFGADCPRTIYLEKPLLPNINSDDSSVLG